VDVTSTLNKPRGVGGLAVLSMAKPLIFRIRAGGSGDGRPELVCGCSCSTFYRLSSGLDQEEEEGRLVEAIFEDTAALPVELLGAGGTVKLGSWPRPAPSALVTVAVTPSTSKKIASNRLKGQPQCRVCVNLPCPTVFDILCLSFMVFDALQSRSLSRLVQLSTQQDVFVP